MEINAMMKFFKQLQKKKVIKNAINISFICSFAFINKIHEWNKHQ